jgi:hypothetical protein
VTVLATVHVLLVLELTVYKVAVPSATKLTMIAPEPAFATVGVANAADADTAVEFAEFPNGAEEPEATTQKTYEVPFVSPVTVQFWLPVGGVAVLATVHVATETVGAAAVAACTVYKVSDPSAVNVTVTD